MIYGRNIMNESQVLTIIISFIFYLGTMIGGVFWVMKRIDSRIDERVELHPIVKKNEKGVTELTTIKNDIEEIKEDVKEITKVVRRTEIVIAKAGINGK